MLVQDTTRLRKHYTHTVWFALDLASVLPTDLLYIHFGVQTAIVRINRVLRVPRISEFFDKTDSRTNFPYVFRVAQLILYIIVSFHWNACIYYQV